MAYSQQKHGLLGPITQHKKNRRATKKTVRHTCQRIAHVKNRMVIVSIFFCDYETTRRHETDTHKHARVTFNVPKSTDWTHSCSSGHRRDEICEFGSVVCCHSVWMVLERKLWLLLNFLTYTSTFVANKRAVKREFCASDTESRMLIASTLDSILFIHISLIPPKKTPYILWPMRWDSSDKKCAAWIFVILFQQQMLQQQRQDTIFMLFISLCVVFCSQIVSLFISLNVYFRLTSFVSLFQTLCEWITWIVLSTTVKPIFLLIFDS